MRALSSVNTVLKALIAVALLLVSLTAVGVSVDMHPAGGGVYRAGHCQRRRVSRSLRGTSGGSLLRRRRRNQRAHRSGRMCARPVSAA